ESHSINIEWRYYTDGKAWLGKGVYKWLGPRGGQKSLTAFWMSIWDGFFQVTVYIQEKHRDGALNLALGDSAMQMLKQAATMGKHFPLTFEIASNSPFGDLFTLIEYKKSLG
ncbi:MAG: DUF3788 domain-containing protein, partial [Eubacteriaceae bacterium]|nr:DUF3788 domain-containing protein [Eubacteriaceae bacterium]